MLKAFSYGMIGAFTLGLAVTLYGTANLLLEF